MIKEGENFPLNGACMFCYSFDTRSQTETETLGERFSEVLLPGDVVAMYGDLGAGKTAFTRGVVRGLGCDAAVSSPTFSIVNEYRTPTGVFAHCDMYRIVSEDDLYSTGFYDYLDGKGIVFMEWSENVPFAVDADAIRLTISKGEGDERFFRVESPRKLF